MLSHPAALHTSVPYPNPWCPTLTLGCGRHLTCCWRCRYAWAATGSRAHGRPLSLNRKLKASFGVTGVLPAAGAAGAVAVRGRRLARRAHGSPRRASVRPCPPAPLPCRGAARAVQVLGDEWALLLCDSPTCSDASCLHCCTTGSCEPCFASCLVGACLALLKRVRAVRARLKGHKQAC